MYEAFITSVAYKIKKCWPFVSEDARLREWLASPCCRRMRRCICHRSTPTENILSGHFWERTGYPSWSTFGNRPARSNPQLRWVVISCSSTTIDGSQRALSTKLHSQALTDRMVFMHFPHMLHAGIATSRQITNRPGEIRTWVTWSERKRSNVPINEIRNWT